VSTPAPPIITVTVLVVDDDDGVRRFIARELEQAGFRVLTAADGDIALRMMKQSDIQVHLVVCDLLMPVLDGYQLAAMLERLPNAPEIVFISAYRSDLEFDRPIVTKPFHLADLSAAVHRILEKQRTPPAEAAGETGLRGASARTHISPE
jgi:CheY-like chemotaxis protein